MTRYALTAILAVVALSTRVLGQGTSSSAAPPPPSSTSGPPGPAPTAPPPAPSAAPVPLADKRFPYPDGIPYKADTDSGPRGTQFGYNRCNSTTEGPNSLCQTSFINSIEDFCLWAPPEPDSTIGDTEGEAVAWCTRPGRGTRLIPRGALKGVQFMKTPDYIQVVGFMDQTLINIQAGDYGGEMDPHGADLRGNPLGGLVYSNAFGGSATSFQQVIEWHNFMGSDTFCFKACDPAGPNAARFCEHIYDRIGCAYNAPNAAQNGTFVSCDGENQDFPGVYTTDGGVTMTYTQPPESLGVISTIPYSARIPASSNCVTYTSASIYTALPTASSNPSPPSVTTRASTSATSSRTGASATATSGARSLSVASSLASIIGITLAVVLFA